MHQSNLLHLKKESSLEIMTDLPFSLTVYCLSNKHSWFYEINSSEALFLFPTCYESYKPCISGYNKEQH